MEAMVNPGFWRGRRVLVTGHTGFKGGWLSLWLRALGAEVSGFALAPPTQPSLCEVAGVESGMRVTRADIRDLSAVRRAVDESGAEIILHLAAQALVRHSYADPVETYASNVMGTVHVLEAARLAAGVKALVVVTSDKCYENREWAWGYRENEPMGGHDPYSNSKGCAELVTSAYRRSYFQDAGRHVASARAGNVIGGGDWAADRLVPDIIRAVARGDAVSIRSPGAIRPWQHVLEPLSGYLMLAQRLFESGAAFADGWNFGPADDDARPVKDVVGLVTEMWGDGARWELDARPQPHEAHYLKLDCSRARQVLGWHPRLALADALRWTVEWYRAHRSGADMHAFCLEQIARYQSLERA